MAVSIEVDLDSQTQSSAFLSERPEFGHCASFQFKDGVYLHLNAKDPSDLIWAGEQIKAAGLAARAIQVEAAATK